MEKILYKISDENGIHARPAGLIVNTAKKYTSKVTLVRSGKTADAKKLFAVMGLGIACGDEIEIVAEGDDEREAVVDIERVMKSAGL